MVVIYVDVIRHYLLTFHWFIIIIFLIFDQNLEPTKQDKGKVPYAIVIGVSCGGIFVLAVLSIYLIRYCRRRKMLSLRRVSDMMLADVICPNPEKYALRETESKEDTVRYEETGMWKDTVRQEELAILQDATRYKKSEFSNGATY